MENGTNGHPEYLEKRFDCYEIDWVIENFCVTPCGDGWTIQNPEFTLKGSQSTTWLMTLNCSKSDSGHALGLTLRRSPTDEGPKCVWVDWRGSMPRPISRDFGHDLLMTPYVKGASFTMELGSVEDVIEKFDVFDYDSFEIRSHLVFFEEDRNGFETCGDFGVKSLSDKLLQLFRSKMHCDLKLKFEGQGKETLWIPAHKVVVCSRIKELNYLLEKSGTRVEEENGAAYDVLDLSSLNYHAMTRILEYAYSGDFKYVFSNPSLEIYDCVHELKISELKPFFVPNKLRFRTIVECQEFHFTWVIPDAKDLLKQESVSSPLFADGCFDKDFQIHFATKKESGANFCGLHVQAKESVASPNACFECAIKNASNSYFFAKRSRVSAENTEKYGFGEYVRRNIVQYIADEKSIKIIARLRLSNGATRSWVEKQKITFTDCMSCDKSFELLRTSIEAAYETGFFSDVQISVSDTSFNLHKSILYARCAKLYILVDYKDQTESYFARIEPRIFNQVMKYLYSGIVYSNENESDVIDIYDLAVNLHLSFLKNVCSTFIKALIQNNPTIREKVAAIAEKHKDRGLLEALKHCISGQES